MFDCSRDKIIYSRMLENIKYSYNNILEMINDRKYLNKNKKFYDNNEEILHKYCVKLQINDENNHLITGNDIISVKNADKNKLVVRFLNINSQKDKIPDKTSLKTFIIKQTWELVKEYEILNFKENPTNNFDITKFLNNKKFNYKLKDNILKSGFTEKLLNGTKKFEQFLGLREKNKCTINFVVVVNLLFYPYNKKILNLEHLYFKNVQLFNIKNFKYNLTKHYLVPKHEYISDKEFLVDCSKKFNQQYDIQDLKSKLPKIFLHDPVVRYYNFKYKNIVKITRNLKLNYDEPYKPDKLGILSNNEIYYRFVDNDIDNMFDLSEEDENIKL